MPFCAKLFYRYYDRGAASYAYPTLYLHGLGGTYLSWPHTLRRLPGKRIYALDLPGHGLSDTPACCSTHELTDHLHRFITELGIFSFALVGHSMGSAAAFDYAATYPEHIRGLALISCGHIFRFSEELMYSLKSEASRKNVIEFFNNKGFHPEFSQSLRRKILEPLNCIRISVLQADIKICSSFSAYRSLNKFTFPVQLIAGRNDKLAPSTDIQQLKYHLPNASLCTLDQCGHMAIFEKTEVIKKTLQAFLEKVTSPVYQ